MKVYEAVLLAILTALIAVFWVLRCLPEPNAQPGPARTAPISCCK